MKEVAKIGLSVDDVVRLNSGGPEMLIIGFETAIAGGVVARCKWTDEADRTFEKLFDGRCLTLLRVAA